MTGLKLVIKLKKPPEQSPEPAVAIKQDFPQADKKRKRSETVPTGNHFQYAQAGFASQTSPVTVPKKQNVGTKPFSVKLPSQAIATAVSGPSIVKPPKLTIKHPSKVSLGPPGSLQQPKTVVNPVTVPRVVIKSLPISDEARAIAQQVQQDVKHRYQHDATKLPIPNGPKVKFRTSAPAPPSVPVDEGPPKAKKPKLNDTPGKSSAQSLEGRSPSSSKKLKSIKLNTSDPLAAPPSGTESTGLKPQSGGITLPSLKLEVSMPNAVKNERASKPRPPDRQDLEHVVDKIQKKDTRDIFRHPVTEDVAPGYFSVVTRPMDFTTIRQRLASGYYTNWELLEDDVCVMFDNAMAYNSPDTVFHKQARTLKDTARKFIELGKQGVTTVRGRASGVVRAHNARAAQEERVEKEAPKAPAQPQKQPARSSKTTHKGTLTSVKHMSLNFMGGEDGGALEAAAEDGVTPKSQGGPRPVVRDNDGRRHLPLDENARNSFRPKAGSTTPLSLWGGLANGATAEGVQFAHGRPSLKPINMQLEAYVESISRFTAGCSPALQKLVLARAMDTVAVEGKKTPKPPIVQPSPVMMRPTDLIKPNMAAPLMDKSGMVQAAGSTGGSSSSQAHAQAALAQTLQMMAKMNANSSNGGLNVANMTGAQLAAALQSRTSAASSFTPQQLLQQHQQTPTVPSHDQLVWQLAAHQQQQQRQQQQQQSGVVVGGTSGGMQLQQHQHQRPTLPGSQPVLYHQGTAGQPQLASILAAHQQQQQQMLQQVSQQQQHPLYQQTAQLQQQQQQQALQQQQQQQQALQQQQQQQPSMQVVYQPQQQQLRPGGMYPNTGLQQVAGAQQSLLQGASQAQLYQQAGLVGQQHLASRMAAAAPQAQQYLAQPNLMQAQQANLVQAPQQLPSSGNPIGMHYSQGLAQLFQQGVMPSAGMGATGQGQQ